MATATTKRPIPGQIAAGVSSNSQMLNPNATSSASSMAAPPITPNMVRTESGAVG